MTKEFFKKNIYTLALIALCIFILVSIPSQIKVSLISKAAISPRLFPYFATIGTLICCVLSFIADAFISIRKQKKGITIAVEKDENVSPFKGLITIAILFAWWAVLKHVGFIISTIVVMFILSFMLGNRNKVSLIVFPVVFTLLIYFAFANLLHVNLPEILFR